MSLGPSDFFATFIIAVALGGMGIVLGGINVWLLAAPGVWAGFWALYFYLQLTAPQDEESKVESHGVKGR